MTHPGPGELLAVAEQAADAGAEVLRHYFRSRDLEVREKEANDFVTRADRESEQAILQVVRRRFPEHQVLAEESGLSGAVAETAGRPSGSEYRWIIDPLDGTANFMQGLPMFCISIACRGPGETLAGVVLDPIRQELFTAAAGLGASWNGQPMRVSSRPGVDGSFLATGYPFRAKDALETYLGIFGDLLRTARGIRRCGAAALDLAYTAAGVFDGFFEFRLSPWDIAAGDLLIREAGGLVSDLDGGDDFLASGNVLAGAGGVHRDLLETVSRHTSERQLDRLTPRR